MRNRLASVFALTAFLAMAVPTAGSASTDTATRIGHLWVSPKGSGSTCSQSKPCSIETGFTATSNYTTGTMMIEPGTYGSPSKPISTSLTAATPFGRIGGEPGKPAPTIYSDADYNGIVLAAGSDFNLVYYGTDTGIALEDVATLDHVSVESTGEYACEIEGTSVTDSLCATTTADSGGVYEEPKQGRTSFVNDTLIGDGSGGVALVAYAQTEDATDTVSLVNTIAEGDPRNYDIVASTVNTVYDGSIDVTLAHSDSVRFHTNQPIDAPGAATITPSSSDVTAAPEFVNAAKGNFAETAKSPTVDKGQKESGTDLAGNPREMGKATDIGGYELPVEPGTCKLSVTKTTSTSITVTATLDPEGLPTAVELTAQIGGKSEHTTKHVNGDKPTSVSWTVTGLKSHTTVRFGAKATNSAGIRTAAPTSGKTR